MKTHPMQLVSEVWNRGGYRRNHLHLRALQGVLHVNRRKMLGFANGSVFCSNAFLQAFSPCRTAYTARAVHSLLLACAKLYCCALYGNNNVVLAVNCAKHGFQVYSTRNSRRCFCCNCSRPQPCHMTRWCKRRAKSLRSCCRCSSRRAAQTCWRKCVLKQ